VTCYLKHRRDATRIIFEVLSIAKFGITKTQIVYRANLSFRMAGRYVASLLEAGLFQDEWKEGLRTFRLTDSGENFLGQLARLEQGLDELVRRIRDE
jgi:predicted transcriptional regulator